MTMLPILNVPGKLPRWATNGTYVDEPLESNKLDGFKPDYKPPAKWWNWLLNLSYEWIKKIMSTALMNWAENAVISADDVKASIFHPEIGLWVASIDSIGQTNYNSADGHVWFSGVAFGNPGLFNFAAIDTLNYIFADDNDDIRYSPDGGVVGWSTITDATIGGTGFLSVICTKYPVSDFAMVVRGFNPAIVRIAATGITGVWTAPSTPPSFLGAAWGMALIYIEDSTWMLLSGGAPSGALTALFKSTDDGDTWVNVGLVFQATSDGAQHMAYNEESGRLIVVGSNDPTVDVEYIIYSDDLGDTWTQATIDKKGITSTTTIRRVYYCGGGCWVASSRTFDPDTATGIYISTDDGVTWEVADINAAAIGGGGEIAALACDGRKVLALGDAGFNLFSLSI